MTTKLEEKIIKKPVLKKNGDVVTKKAAVKKVISNNEDSGKKTDINSEKKVEIKEISVNQVRIIKKSDRQKLDKLNRAYATGKRKNAIAKVWLKKGSGKITINGKEAGDYLKRSILEVIVNVPFEVTETQDKFDIECSVLGGGLSGQAGAIRQGISKALNVYNREAYRKELKTAGLLTRDARIVERKKTGLKKARKGQVFSKR